MKRSMLILMVVVLLSTVPVFAGPLNKQQVSATANWLAHLDYEQVTTSQIGQLVRQEMAKFGIEEKLEDFATVFSFHPIDDVRDVRVYGNGPAREEAVVMIEADFDQEKLLALVRLNEHYEEIEYGDITLNRWLHEDEKSGESQMMYGCLCNGDLVVMSAGLDAVTQAVDVLKGTASNAASGVFDQAELNARGAFLQVAANDVAQMAQEQGKGAGFGQTDAIGLAIGETEGTFYIYLGLLAKSEEAASNITKILEGIGALAALAGEEQPVLAAFVQRVQLSCQDNAVQIHFESDSELLFQFLKEQGEKRK
ncbi:MAG: hypothetical protein H8E73_00370 [Planctomycetes bacterium]|nr:hypothetical protein [Planctomycetota bacterium]